MSINVNSSFEARSFILIPTDLNNIDNIFLLYSQGKTPIAQMSFQQLSQLATHLFDIVNENKEYEPHELRYLFISQLISEIYSKSERKEELTSLIIQILKMIQEHEACEIIEQTVNMGVFVPVSMFVQDSNKYLTFKEQEQNIKNNLNWILTFLSKSVPNWQITYEFLSNEIQCQERGLYNGISCGNLLEIALLLENRIWETVLSPYREEIFSWVIKAIHPQDMVTLFFFFLQESDFEAALDCLGRKELLEGKEIPLERRDDLSLIAQHLDPSKKNFYFQNIAL